MIRQVRTKVGPKGTADQRDTSNNRESPSVRPLALILDYHALKVVSGCCTTTDLLEEDIGIIDLLENDRELASDYDAVYLVQPTPDSIDYIVRDFKDVDGGDSKTKKNKEKFRPKYRSAFVYCTSPIPKRMMDQLAPVSEFVNRCGALVDFFQDYVCFDERSYQCDRPLAINALSAESSDSYFVNAHLNSILSVCTTLNQKPSVIRYQAGTRSGFPKIIAEKLMQNLDLVYSEASGKPPQSNSKVLIVDRSIDIAALLVHDFHYEDMVLDCLDSAGVEWSLGDDDEDDDNDAATKVSVVPSYLYKYEENGETKEERMLLSERSDEMWAKYRHMHIAEVSSIIQQDIQEFNDTSKISKLQNAAGDNENGGGDGVKDGVEAVRELPVYKEKLKKYSMHVDIINACNNCIETLNLGQVAEIEQALATGVDDDGHTITSDTILPKLNPLLTSSTIGDEQKLRLIALYLTYMDGCTEPFAESLLQKAGLDEVMVCAVKNLLKLRLHQAHNVPSATASTTKQTHIYAKNKTMLKRNKERARKAPIRISRFVPRLGEVMEQMQTNMVDEQAYPNVCPARNTVAASGRTAYASATVRGTTGGKQRGGSLSPGRSAFQSLGSAANWGGESPRGGRGMPATAGSKDKLIVCVLGGITLAEIRQAFDLSDEFGIDVVAGGSAIFTAKRLVEALVSNDSEEGV
ncbi:Syntaxin-binding protein 3 [Perkinsus olseni]|uniref:Syntaxin-binding protein 3 n=1 Tax=Perkinsus olseni TaxID=32597 RepID=A0A7J6RBN7_PEROL|nr:Syntaxin-binding protein 3 [Perkinsus olseni]